MPVLLFAELLRSASAAEHYAEVAFLIHAHGFGLEPGVFDRFIRGGNCQRHRARDVLTFACIDPSEFIEVGNFAGDLHRQIAYIKARDALHSALTCENRAAECIFADSVWAYYAHTCDDGALCHRFGPSEAIVCRGIMRC